MNSYKCLIAFIAALICSIVNVYADANPAIEDVSLNEGQYEDNQYNYAYFDVEVKEAGEYYAEFWLMPTQYPDGSFTNFTVYINEELVGSIIPGKGNWQAVRINNADRIRLKKGANQIKIAVPSPEMPSVETISLALNEADALLSPTSYDDFCHNAQQEMAFDIPEEDESLVYSSNSNEFATKHFFDVPLVYTFYVDFNFKEGQVVHLATSSGQTHDIDMFYIGEGSVHNAPRPEMDIQLDSEVLSGTDPTDETNGMTKIKLTNAYKWANSDEMQLLNWKCLSLLDLSSKKHRVSKNLTVPKNGIYRIRLRHRDNGATGIATLCVNNQFSYKDVPVSFNWVNCEIPANGNEYGTMTICNDRENDDPMIFIHGADADRIVGFNDDASSEMRRIHELSQYDSHIIQEYKIKTSGISVSNFSSFEPVSRCEIIAGVDESIFTPEPDFISSPKGQESDNSMQLMTESPNIRIEGSLMQTGVIDITAESDIRYVTVSDISGNLILSQMGRGMSIQLSAKDLNIKDAGIYIVRVATDEGVACKKVTIK